MVSLDLVDCPSCGEPNSQGSDRCSVCLRPFGQSDLPEHETLFSSSPFSEQIASLKPIQIATLQIDSSVSEVVELLRDSISGAVLIFDDESLVGIFTEIDIVRKTAGLKGVMSKPISEFMTVDPVVLRETDSVAVALSKMSFGGFHHVPVIRHSVESSDLVRMDDIIGLLTARNAVRWLVERFLD
jgi:CBS domain-containing protein